MCGKMAVLFWKHFIYISFIYYRFIHVTYKQKISTLKQRYVYTYMS